MEKLGRNGEYYMHRHGERHEISFATQQTVGWSTIVLGVLLALGEYLAWSAGMQYLLAALTVVAGIWLVATR